MNKIPNFSYNINKTDIEGFKASLRSSLPSKYMKFYMFLYPTYVSQLGDTAFHFKLIGKHIIYIKEEKLV